MNAHNVEMARLRTEFPTIDRDQRILAWKFAVGCLVRSDLNDDPEASLHNAALAERIFAREGYPEKEGWIEREKSRQLPHHLETRREIMRFRKADDLPGNRQAAMRALGFFAIREQYENEDVAYALIMGSFEHEGAAA